MEKTITITYEQFKREAEIAALDEKECEAMADVVKQLFGEDFAWEFRKYWKRNN